MTEQAKAVLNDMFYGDSYATWCDKAGRCWHDGDAVMAKLLDAGMIVVERETAREKIAMTLYQIVSRYSTAFERQTGEPSKGMDMPLVIDRHAADAVLRAMQQSDAESDEDAESR